MVKIYVACPAAVATGGPELLHQLCNKLTEIGYDSSMYYYRKFEGNPVNERYKIYNNKYVLDILDNENNIIIVPEVDINLLKKFKKSRKIIWWLSVDNYLNRVNSTRNKVKSLMGLLNFNINNENIIHFVQSDYAYNFLKIKKINEKNIYYLSDYLNDIFIKESNSYNLEKQDYVLYNPKKGYEFTKKIIEEAPDIKWKALENLTPKEMNNLMKESKVYIDFGNHPGKDRIPREAAICDCCIITGKRGSAKFKKDVNIPDEFKFDDKDENIKDIVKKIRFLLNNYHEDIQKFDKYKKIILDEKKIFDIDVRKIFSEII